MIASATLDLSRGPLVTAVSAHTARVSFTTTASVTAELQITGTSVPAGSGTRHIAALTSLAAGKRYHYRVVAKGATLARGSFKTAPVGQSSFTFAVVGDFGSGDENQRAVARLIRSWKPDFLLSTGDQSYLLGLDQLLERNIFNPYRQLFRESVFFPTLGNHDVFLNGGADELSALDFPQGKRYYRFAWGLASYTVIDSDSPVGGATEQGQFVARSFSRGSCFRFAAWHHPPWSEYSGGIAGALRRNVVPLVEQAKLDVVFLGHVHDYERTKPRHGVTYLTVGTGGAAIGRYPNSSIPLEHKVLNTFGALRVDVNGRGARFRFMDTHGRVLDAFRRTCRTRV